MPDQKPIRIVIVEDQVLLRGALAKTLAGEPECTIVGECATVDAAVQFVKSADVDIVLLDINLGSEQGGAFLNRASAIGYRGKVLVVTAGVSEREAAWLLSSGCSGVFLKSEPLPVLVQRVKDIAYGTSEELDAVSVRAIVSQCKSAAQGLPKPLTPRENQALRCVCEGLTNKEIAQRMAISEATVKSFLQQLFTKTGARTRARLVAIAIEQYWEQLD
jgi:two-component system nitrate/nitrite response regulator NarL